MKKCQFCNKSYSNSSLKCGCGYPVDGSPEERKTFLKTKLILARNEIDQSERHLKIARWIIIGIGLLALVGVAVNLSNPNIGRAVYMQGAFAISFVLIGVFFNRFPVVACAVGLLVTFLFFPVSLMTILILIFLGIGLYFAVGVLRAAKKRASIERMIDDVG